VEDVEPPRQFCLDQARYRFLTKPKERKWVELILIPGFATRPGRFKRSDRLLQRHLRTGKGETMVLPRRGPDLSDRWFAFLKAVSARYQNRPAFLKIARTPHFGDAEMSLPNAPADLCTWVQLGYTSDR